MKKLIKDKINYTDYTIPIAKYDRDINREFQKISKGKRSFSVNTRHIEKQLFYDSKKRDLSVDS